MKKSLMVILGSLMILAMSTSFVAASENVVIGAPNATALATDNTGNYCGGSCRRGQGQGGYCGGRGSCYNGNANNSGK